MNSVVKAAEGKANQAIEQLEKLEAQKWELAKALDEAPTISAMGLIMMKLNDVMLDIYYLEMRAKGIGRKKAKQELYRVLESSGFEMKEQMKGLK